MDNADGLWTKALTNADSPFKIRKEWGFERFAVKCTSSTAVQITGSRTVATEGGTPLPSTAVSLQENEVFNWSKDKGVQDYTITIPSGATCEVAGL